ncbi:MAG: hypothetical protein FGM15_06175 [Chthoniobacterales bacterium]|nr:hypothetical protein [Chthoniobacterales bacterium]
MIDNPTLRSTVCGIAAVLCLATMAHAEDLPLENPDFAQGLAGWTQIGWGNDNPGMVYSTSPGAHIYQTVPSHTISADKLKYTVRYRIGSMDPARGWEFPEMTVNLVTHVGGEGYANKGGRTIEAPTEYSGEWQEKTWTLDADTAGKSLAVSFNLGDRQEGNVAVHLYEVQIACEARPPPLSLRAERRWPAAMVPQPIKDGPFAGLYREGPPGDASAMRVDFDAESGALIHLGLDTEGGGREKMNLLREPASVSAGKLADGKVASSAPGQVKVDAAGTELDWKAGVPEGGLTLTVAAPAQSTDDVEVRLPLRPALSAVTVLGGRWERDGTVHPPFLLNAPDLGLVLVKATPADAGTARIQGMRDGSHGSRNNKLDLSLISKAAAGKPVVWSFEPVQLPPPEGLKETALWPAIRRGWLNALQATAPWGEASSTVSAPPGLYANNVLSDLVSGLMHYWGDAVLLSPALPQGIELNEAMRRTVDHFLTRTFPMAATNPRMKLIRSEAEIAALGNSTVMVSAEADGAVPCYHDHIQMLDGISGTLTGAWNVWKADGNNQWLVTRWEVLEKIASFLERNDTDGDGLVESPNSGNEGTFAMEFGSGSSAYDTVNSGHKDAFINIQVYRAWLGLAEMAEALGHPDRAAHWRERAAKLRAAFLPCFYNPETRWLGWWRSRDGVLHDYASPWITGFAVRNGLLSPEEGRPMLKKLWAKIDEVGFDRFDLGIPTTLLPIKPGDYHYGPGGDRSVASNPFKHYLNGGCCVSDTFHFLVASHMAGLGDRADRVLAAMLQRQWAGAHENGGGFQNGIGGGGEFYTWDGTPCGYEGHLTYSYTFLQTALLREPALRERLHGKPSVK